MKKKININIELDLVEYERLKDICLEQSPKMFLQSFIKKRLLGGMERKESKYKPLQEFEILKKNLKLYNIRQIDISSYFKISQASVSSFLKTESRDSILYSKFFPYSREEKELLKVLFDIYTDKNFNSGLKDIDKNTQGYFYKTINQLVGKVSIKDDIHQILQEIFTLNLMSSLMTIFLRLNIAKKITKEDFFEIIKKNKNSIIDIDRNKIADKDLEFLAQYIDNSYKIIIKEMLSYT